MTDTTSVTYCYAHPGRETSLRCKRCDRYICTSCAKSTPTGYICRDCMRERQKSFDTAVWYDFLLAFAVSSLLSLLASFLVTLISGIGFFGWFLILGGSPAAAAVIAESVRSVTRRHRSRSLFLTAAGGVAFGVLPILIVQILGMDLFRILFQVIYLVIAVPMVYTRLSGIQLNK